MSTGSSEHSILLPDGRRVPLVLLRHAQARRLRMRFDPVRGEARLTLPPRAALRSALAWAAEQSDWIERQCLRMRETVRIADGATIPIEGRPVRIIATGTPGRRIALEEDVMIVGGPAAHAGARVLRWLKERARDALTQETRALAEAHGLPLSTVSIGDPRSRWGSCASSGAIRYSWRLILAPPHVRLATVAHEVAHLKHMHHGPAFHAFVDAISPVDPDRARRWLRREGAALHRYMV